MKVFVTVKAGAKKKFLKQIDETHFAISVREPAKENRANIAVLEALAAHLGISYGLLSLVAGRSSRSKIIEIQK